MNQNYIQVFKNKSGGISIEYSKPDDDGKMEDIQILAISKDDATNIGRALIEIDCDKGVF